MCRLRTPRALHAPIEVHAKHGQAEALLVAGGRVLRKAATSSIQPCGTRSNASVVMDKFSMPWLQKNDTCSAWRRAMLPRVRAGLSPGEPVVGKEDHEDAMGLEGRHRILSIQVHQGADVPVKLVQLPETIERRATEEVGSGQQQRVLQLANGGTCAA